ncbi:Protein arabidillo 1 [Forsythia ovata]|uniref:Protein arabidillo 1 n=1 Tax=Forsythia ovata TaxID=205694 RepID=A0ABD1P1R0_9LAMI
MGNVRSVHLFSVAGTTNIKWNLVLEPWSKLPHLTGLDVFRTDIIPSTVLRLFSSLRSLQVLSALNCPALDNNAIFVSNKNHKDLSESKKSTTYQGVVINEPSPNSRRPTGDEVSSKAKEKAMEPPPKVKPTSKQVHSSSKTTQLGFSSREKRPSSDSRSSPAKKL